MIKVKNVTKIIDKQVILDNINLDLKNGNIYGFIGRNGCGKSMLFRLICGLVAPTKGEVLVNNIDMSKEGLFSGEIGALIEKPSFLPNISGLENLKTLAEINNKITEKDIEKILKEFNLYDDRNKNFGKYSLGMKQKLGIIQAIMENPKIIILDEPFNGLDNKAVEVVRKTLIDRKKQGCLILIATHIKEDIELLCDKVFKLDAGKIVGEYLKEE